MTVERLLMLDEALEDLSMESNLIDENSLAKTRVHLIIRGKKQQNRSKILLE